MSFASWKKESTLFYHGEWFSFFKSKRVFLFSLISFFLLQPCRAISREAARRRRRVESDVFGDLSRLLPLQPSVRAHLDKPSVIRLTLSYMRTRLLFRGNTRKTNKHTHSHTHIDPFSFLCHQTNLWLFFTPQINITHTAVLKLSSVTWKVP